MTPPPVTPVAPCPPPHHPALAPPPSVCRLCPRGRGGGRGGEGREGREGRGGGRGGREGRERGGEGGEGGGEGGEGRGHCGPAHSTHRISHLESLPSLPHSPPLPPFLSSPPHLAQDALQSGHLIQHRNVTLIAALGGPRTQTHNAQDTVMSSEPDYPDTSLQYNCSPHPPPPRCHWQPPLSPARPWLRTASPEAEGHPHTPPPLQAGYPWQPRWALTELATAAMDEAM